MKLILFDCDGTLVDSGDSIHQTMVTSFADRGLPPPTLQQTHSIIGLSLPLAIGQLLGKEPDEEVMWLTQRYKDNFTRHRQAHDHIEPLYEGIGPLLAELGKRDDYLLGIVTGKSQRGVRRVFEQHQIGDLFSVVRTADDCPSKPHPAMVLESCHEMGIDPDDTIVIGDAIYDMQMARAANATAVGVGWGYHHNAGLVGAGAHHVLDHPGELLRILSDRGW